MNALLKLIQKQERNISAIRQRLFFTRKAKCPSCHTRIMMDSISKPVRLCFFCSNCQLLFEK